MTQKNLFDNHGKMIGKIDIGENTLLFVYDQAGRQKGYYHQVHNQTHDNHGKVIGKDDLRLLLLKD
jgi:hypothetical protein